MVDESSVGAVLVVGAAAGGSGEDSLLGSAIGDRVRSGGKDPAYWPFIPVCPLNIDAA